VSVVTMLYSCWQSFIINEDMHLNLVDAMTCDSVSLGPHSKTIFVFAFLQTNTNLLGGFQ